MSRDLIRLMHALFLPADHREECWRPAADVSRTPAGWLVKFDVAGTRPDDIRVLACGRRLTVQGRRRDWTEAETCTYYRMEIAYGCFERSLELPCNLESADVTTEYRDGMLLVRIRTEEAPDEPRS